MARKTQIITIEEEGRDRGKTYILKEMPASQGELWATRVLLAMAKSGVQIPDNLERAGLYGIFVVGFQMLAHSSLEELKPLLDEMMACVRIRPDPNNPEYTRELMENDVEEIKTRIKLRTEVLNLHLGFSIPGIGSTSSTSISPIPGGSQQPKISRPQLRRSSQVVKPPLQN